MSRSIGTAAAITMPSATEATGRLKMIMRSSGVSRQRRAPTTQRASHARLPLCLAVGRRRRVARHAAERQQERARDHERDGVQQQHVVGGGESDERAAERDAGHVRERLGAEDGAVGGVEVLVVDEHRHDCGRDDLEDPGRDAADERERDDRARRGPW